ncbi:lysosomal Pro-X carboxypeptidase-like [Senna tora]|uniref:Lysosomal Pro-X carboxypeptidase-like n=1 Tax=Senna tora TaxID=362788 RepID=A0A834TLG0_9FABA|nr:lysosomal Pro-X carboxypeptidase-like [Senna tora]
MLPRLSPIGDINLHHPSAQAANEIQDFKTFYYRQTLDHFNYRPESYTTFSQRYLINFKNWGGANSSAPIFHRYYGKSVPFGSLKKAIKNANTRGYFNSAQALADYAAVIIHIKKTLNAQKSQLKYPHLALGALASSAPILYFEKPASSYLSGVTRDFRETSETCYETILKSWSEIDRVASEADGLSILSQRFNTCRPLKNSEELIDYLVTKYAAAAQYGGPPLCSGFKGNTTCNVNGLAHGLVHVTETSIGWPWQRCSEITILYEAGNDTMFPPNSYTMNLKSFVMNCKKLFGVSPRPNWVSTYYGGHDIKLVLQRFGSNIIFSNGLRDPYSIDGVLENLSDSIVAVYTINGSHCLDILRAMPSDPELVDQTTRGRNQDNQRMDQTVLC